MPQPPSEPTQQGQLHWHPVLLGLYPALHLLAQNIASVHPEAALPSLAVVALGLGDALSPARRELPLRLVALAAAGDRARD